MIKINTSINPFQQLYIFDDAHTDKTFVALFSDKVLQSAISPIFQGGNVVLLGSQGCGKTMILNLLRPEIRIAYFDEGQEFPVDKSMSDFISAGVNLTHSQISHVAQMSGSYDIRELSLLFADYFNFCVIEDLINTVSIMGQRQDVFGPIVKSVKLDDFASAIAKQECWFGFMDQVDSFCELQERVKHRIKIYRSWVNGNLENNSLPLEFCKSKTIIGEPLVCFSKCLRECNVISSEIPVLIRIDQIEEMHRAQTEKQKSIFMEFRKMLNRLLADREALIHYRMGSRPYGWNNPEYMNIYGSEAKLELRRDYLLIEMDKELFMREEINNTIFREFARDAFCKRIRHYCGEQNIPDDFLGRVLGKSPDPEGRISSLKLTSDKAKAMRALAINPDSGEWSQEWLDFLSELYKGDHGDMLNAVLASAWGQQTGGKKGAGAKKHREDSPPKKDAPWIEKEWWRKERKKHAVLQLMTRCQQRYEWWGESDVISLSDGSILTFIHLCHKIWDAFLKKQSRVEKQQQIDLFQGGHIPETTQKAAIQSASNDWYKKIPEETGGNSRQRFVESLGSFLNKNMLDDRAMSYPGGNGFSIPLSAYNENNARAKFVRDFLNEAVAYGVLSQREHSSKSKRTGRRVKFYLNAVLSPRYQLPESKTKEPLYWNLEQVIDLLEKAKAFSKSVSKVSLKKPEELPLFPGM